MTNRDSSGCTAADFAIFADLPAAGWAADTSTVNLAPGADAAVAVSVTSPTSAGAGDYAIAIHAADTADPAHTGTTTVSYSIAPPPNAAPVAVDDSVVLVDKSAIGIDVRANDSDPDADPLTVIEVTQGAQGSVEIGADGRVLYTPDKRFKGTDSFGYTITDGQQTASATVTVELVRNPK